MNTADEAQVKERSLSARDREKQKQKALREVLKTYDGRLYIWGLLEEARVFSSVWEPSDAIHYRAGKQDFGHFIMAQINEADQEALFQMMREAQKREAENV